MKRIFTLISLSLVVLSCGEDDYYPIESSLDADLKEQLIEVSGGKGLGYFILPESDAFDQIPQDPKNPITPAKVQLGKLLLHETGLGQVPKIDLMKGTYSCASCHQADAGFSSALRQGIGECGVGFGFRGESRTINKSVPVDSVDIQPLRSPTLLHVAYQEVMLWNGQFGGTGINAGTETNWGTIPENYLGYQGVEVQAIKGQGVHRLIIDADLAESLGYKNLFDSAFPEVSVNERYSPLYAGLAIAAYERTLLANQSPWQRWLKGETEALTMEEKQGVKVFFGEGRCYECHTGPALSDMNFYAFGMGDFDNSDGAVVLNDVDMDAIKKGRGGFTKKASDEYKFKTPTLYNMIDNGFYGHGGTFTSVEEVIRYKNVGIPQNKQVPLQNMAPQFGHLYLTDTQIESLTQFLENGLRDPNLKRYVPEALNSGNCFPNNDEQSQLDLNCG
ncbi:cytochrome-c peroxidase [Aquimarina sp. 2-A2]|uniref:cytochrome-c peroxidase n=1 Tax=Aquimarina sp. 2-A2 TaxID=3382644 RepID=UPI00387F2FD1